MKSDRFPLYGIVLVSGLMLLGIGFLLLSHKPEQPGSGTVSLLPSLNALLNAASALLITAGFAFIRRKKVTAHRACMLAALGVSCLFLASYLVYHYSVGSVRFTGQGWSRTLYFPLLISHIVLAALVVPLALIAVYRALAKQFDQHRRIARWTFGVWLYVSVTGVVVYWMLYHL